MLPEGIWIGLGGNQAGSESAMARAVEHLAATWQLRAVSSLYVTAPRDYLPQADFLNAVAHFSLPDSGHDAAGAEHILDVLLDLERQLGRDRSHAIPKGPRLIDLDLLLVGRLCLDSPRLVLPHPAMHLRRFVLDPMLELQPGLQAPGTGLAYAQCQIACRDQAIYSKRRLGYTVRSV
jgi:2-amino-4-hydroxy-6-hydroxymethyldihydropteridine diphosphokinase